jgi:hypothetical protein
MNNPYGFHSMSKQYRQEALRDARTRHLEGRLREDRDEPGGFWNAGLAWRNVLAPLLGGLGTQGSR